LIEQSKEAFMTTQTKEREILRVANAFETIEGPGIPIRRAIPTGAISIEEVDPFLLLDHARLEQMPVLEEGEGTHPHRGFEVLSYVLEGHVDDQGEVGIQRIEAGGLQKITTGSGIEHGGAPSDGTGGPAEMLQIWINLAQKDKKLKPEYQLMAPEEIPETKSGSATIRTLVGKGSPARLHTPAQMLDVRVEADGEFSWELPESYQGYVYVLQGDGHFGSNDVPARKSQVAVLGKGALLRARAGSKGLRFFLAAGQPHREPVRWRGPFVD
jgi:redox-sensitive bicupin YhaK (pirin superfamily)